MFLLATRQLPVSLFSCVSPAVNVVPVQCVLKSRVAAFNSRVSGGFLQDVCLTLSLRRRHVAGLAVWAAVWGAHRAPPPSAAVLVLVPLRQVS